MKKIRFTFVVLCLSALALSLFLTLLSSSPPAVKAAAVPAIPDDCITVTPSILTATWGQSCYKVITDVVVELTGTLTIAPPPGGTVIYFNPGTQLKVYGTLQALGTAEKPLTFTSMVPNPSSQDYWRGIAIENDLIPDVNTIEYATIEFAQNGIRINDEDYVQLNYNHFRFNGDNSPGDLYLGAISGDTDNSEIQFNTLENCHNGIIFNESYNNKIIANTIISTPHYGIFFNAQDTHGGSNNEIRANQIYSSSSGGIRLEYGGQNTITHNLIAYSPASSTLAAAIEISKNLDTSLIVDNIVYAPQQALNYYSPITTITALGNALCARPNAPKLHNDGAAQLAPAPENWWSTNTPTAGTDYTNAVVTDPMTLSVTAGLTSALADEFIPIPLTITLRSLSGRTVPELPAGAFPNSPNPRRLYLQTSSGTLNTTALLLDDQGQATALLTAPSHAGTVIITVTDFCGYPVTTAVKFVEPQIVLQKTTAVTQVEVGSPSSAITYTLNYANIGDIPAPGLELTDTLPTGLTYLSNSSPAPFENNGATLRWTLPDLSPHETISFNLILSPTGELSFCQKSVTNTAQLSSRLSLSRNLVVTATAPPVFIQCRDTTDLEVIKDDHVGPSTLTATQSLVDPITDHRDYVSEGDWITYTIAVFNHGPAPATGIVLTETIPTYTTYLERGFGWISLDGRTYTRLIPDLEPETGYLTYIVVQVNDPLPEEVTNLVNLVCGENQTPDPNLINNCHYEDTPILRRPLRISKSGPLCVLPGSAFNYTPYYTNTNLSIALTNIVITDTLPPFVTHVVSPADGWQCLGNRCTLTIPTLAAGAGTTGPWLQVQLDPAVDTPWITNTIEISGGYSYSLRSQVAAGPDLSIVKNDNVGPLPPVQRSRWQELSRRLYGKAAPRADQREFVRPGEQITYTLLYVNTGYGTANHVTITEHLPAYTRYVGGGWTHIGGNNYIRTLNSLAPNMGGELQFIVEVIDPFPQNTDHVINVVDIASDQTECNTTNNTSNDHTPVHSNGLLYYFVNKHSNRIDIYSPSEQQYKNPIPAGQWPYSALKVDNLLYVLNYEWQEPNDSPDSPTSTVTLINLETQTQEKQLIVAQHPTKAAYLDGRIYIAHDGNGEGITVIDHANRTVIAHPHPITTGISMKNYGYFGITADSRRHRLYVTKRDQDGLGIWMITPLANDQYSFVRVVDTQWFEGQNLAPYAIGYNPLTDRLYVVFPQRDELWVYNPANFERLAVYQTGRQGAPETKAPGHGLAFSGYCTYVSNYEEKSLTILAEGPCVEEPLSITPAPTGNHRLFLPLLMRNAPEYPHVYPPIPLNGSPKGIWADNNVILVALYETNSIAVFNPRTLQFLGNISSQGDWPFDVVVGEAPTP